MAIRGVGRRLSILGVLLLASTALSGCSASESAACPSWASYATPADAATHATAVVAGRVTDKTGTVPMFNTSANVWTLEVETWLKGTGATRVNVASPPPSCNLPYDDGEDPFQKALDYKGVVVFLTQTDSGWQALSPIQGVVESSDGKIPTSW